MTRYCCNFCTSDISDLDGRSICDCVLDNGGDYEISAAIALLYVDPDCDECDSLGHRHCNECDGTGYVHYECSYGVGEIEWSTKEKPGEDPVLK